MFLKASKTKLRKGVAIMSFSLTSTAFSQGQLIPGEYTCQGQDVSPALHWSGQPSGTQSLALIMDDPDAPVGTWIHWVLYNLSPESQGLSKGVVPGSKELEGSQDGTNSWQKLGYGGPCPPSGEHRYFFKLYALDTRLNLSSGANKQQLLKAMEGHILAQAELMGTYRKR
jgi:Raf kinase inhibitor-like YbhB/YbcL family protein